MLNDDDAAPDLETATNKELFNEVKRRMNETAEFRAQVDEILRCSARIAFGDYTDLPRLKLLFHDVGVYGDSDVMLAPLLWNEP